MGTSLLLHTVDVVDGSRVLIDGQVTGAALAGPGPDYGWTLPTAPAQPEMLALQILSPTGMQSNALALPVVAPPLAAIEPQEVEAGFSPFALHWPDQVGITGPGTQFDVFRGTTADLHTIGFPAGGCLTPGSLSTPELADPDVPASGAAFYYVIRAQNQLNVTTWGSPARDAGIDASVATCGVLFP